MSPSFLTYSSSPSFSAGDIFRAAGLSNVAWLPVTWDLRHQLLELIADHKSRGIFNWWIVKRSLPSSHGCQLPLVTDDIRRIVRLVETGPCIASHCKQLLH